MSEQLHRAGMRKVLLFDDAYTEHKHGFVTTINPAERLGGAVLTPDQPWESAGFAGDSSTTILFEDGVYKMWYPIGNPEPEKATAHVLSPAEVASLDLTGVPAKFLADVACPSRYYLCYATSRDGVVWEKPNLGLFEVQGRRDNNVVLGGRIGATVFVDPNGPPERMYKMIHGGSLRLPHWHRQQNQFIRMAYTGIYGAYSADGIHWTCTDRPIIPWYTDTTNVCYWDDHIGKYVAFVRWDKDMIYEDGKTVMTGPTHETYRIIARTESADFEDFPPPTIVMEPRPEEVADYYQGMDLYNSAAVKYPFAPDVHLLFPSFFYHAPDTLDVHIATSRDGVHYDRHDEPFVTLGAPDAFDAKQLYMATGMAREGNRIVMYYVGYSLGHDVPNSKRGRSAIGRVAFRLDGFASQDAGAGGGGCNTVPIEVAGRCLTVNLETRRGGWLKAALLRPSGDAIAGKGIGDCRAITGDHQGARLHWADSCDLSSLRGDAVRIRFEGRSVKLYAFEWSP